MKNNRKPRCCRRSNYTKEKKMNIIFYVSWMPVLKKSRHNYRKIIWKHFPKDSSEYFQKFWSLYYCFSYAKFNFKMPSFPFVWSMFVALLKIRDIFISINIARELDQGHERQKWKGEKETFLRHQEELKEGKGSEGEGSHVCMWGQGSLRWNSRRLQGGVEEGEADGSGRVPPPTVQVTRPHILRCAASILSQGTSALGLRSSLAARIQLSLTCGSHLLHSWRPPFLSRSPRPCPAPLPWTYPRPWVMESPALFCKQLSSKTPAPPMTPLLLSSLFIDFPVLTLCLPARVALERPPHVQPAGATTSHPHLCS